jgi:Na+/H+ antiporter NhaD/arsenite permease-like protein
VTFMRFLRYGIPVTAVQLLVAAGYLWARFL